MKCVIFSRMISKHIKNVTMNIKISVVIATMCLAVLCSCEKEETPKPTLTVSTEEIVLGSTGMTDKDAPGVFEITASTGWTLKCTSWLTPNVTSGENGTSQVTVTAPETTEERVGYITVISNKRTDVRTFITIKQLDVDLVASTLTVSPKLITVEFEGRTSEGNQPVVKISTNKKWAITGLPEWITASPVSGTAGTDIPITLTINRNEQTARDGSFTINAGTLSEPVAITQLAEVQHLTVAPVSIEVDADGKTLEGGVSPAVKITTNKDWTVTGLPGWITATPASGIAGQDVTITLTVNSNTEKERTAYFRINAGYLSEIVTVYQSENNSFKTEFPVIIGQGTIQPVNNVQITKHGNYWEVEATGPSATFPLALSEGLPEKIPCAFEFEYQLSDNLPSLWLFFNKVQYLVGHEIAGIPLTATAGVDPDNEALWTPVSVNTWWFTTEFGWGVDYTELGMWFRQENPCKLLIRNVKFKRL